MTGGTIDYTQLDSLKRDLEEDFAEVFEAIFDSLSVLLDELRERPEDQETRTRLFHSLKSPARSLGAVALGDEAEKYEKQSRNGELENLDQALLSLEALLSEIQKELDGYDPS